MADGGASNKIDFTKYYKEKNKMEQETVDEEIIDELWQRTCPNCNHSHDIDYPKCPNCSYNYLE